MKKVPKIFEDLERLAHLVPVPFHWVDTDVVIMGLNQSCPANMGGPPALEGYIGKNPQEIYPVEMAKMIYENTKKVISQRRTIVFKESGYDLTTGKRRCCNVIKAPLFEDGEVVGVVSVSIDNTAEKEAEEQRVKVKSIKNSSKDAKNAVAKLVPWIKDPLSANEQKLNDVLAMLDRLQVDSSLVEQKREIIENLKDVNHNNKKVKNLVNIELNKIKKDLDFSGDS